MGSHMKRTIFEEQTAKALKKWQKAAREKRKLRKGGTTEVSSQNSGETAPSQGTSPLHLLHKYNKASSHAEDTDSVLYSPRSYQSDTDFSDTEGSSTTTTHHPLNETITPPPPLPTHHQAPRNHETTTHNIDFSFDKP